MAEMKLRRHVPFALRVHRATDRRPFALNFVKWCETRHVRLDDVFSQKGYKKRLAGAISTGKQLS